jgi:hypothetical protein
MHIYEVNHGRFESVITGVVQFGLVWFFNLEMTKLELKVWFFFGLVWSGSGFFPVRVTGLLNTRCRSSPSCTNLDIIVASVFYATLFRIGSTI